MGRRDSSVRCSSCNGWCHLRCSDLANPDDWSLAFACPRCPVSLPALPAFHTNAQVFNLATPPSFKLLQFGINGLLGKLDLPLAFVRSHSIAAAAI
ncbi:unnamed protein product [Dibothriocephalus latus]|uniref:Uncharacterized protein n=1 Tax=Dibothriocephalus latus TaxID=60516 RepID=A0A3P7LU40_DIBLA|nr:unnamed protein product [Dibothriocephalus latus]